MGIFRPERMKATGYWRNCIGRGVMIDTRYRMLLEIKKGEMDGTCSRHWRDEKWVQECRCGGWHLFILMWTGTRGGFVTSW